MSRVPVLTVDGATCAAALSCKEMDYPKEGNMALIYSIGLACTEFSIEMI